MAERAGIQKRWFLCIILLVVFSLILYVTNQYKFPQSFPNHKAQNFEVTMLAGADLPDLEPGIMFVETSDTLIPSELTMCAIESAALVNSRKQVYYFIKEFSGNISALEQTKFKGLHLLSSIHNITLLPLDLDDLFYGTPLFDWYKKIDPEHEEYWIHVLSDACRIALLWKYGGIYLDTDIISLKPLDFINFICEQSYNYANGAALGFSRNHPFTKESMFEYVEKYIGGKWGQQGPDLITRMLKKWCETQEINDFLNKTCKGVTFYPKDWFYPIPYSNWQSYFENGRWEENNSVEDQFSETRGVHIWNFLSNRNTRYIKDTQSYMEYFFKNYCPRTYETLQQ
ncbi:lactosylceramide 4-alpha-galactosyltransferase-like [Amblyraja radiata]|uniref:lactosylceramide 4-alpha-galactosyltransferase-like n=1 Tax=Amblyraja radiata TaxID=386614 RepID=UPI001403E93E|nr:lactosylceramide 4-alpha-galactosyltransferase-like [Amblyraja radiata]XP_032887547.1 lactosylceramide 4-alpha-galactosyltransferase-like [Amblyraja radiata]XP_032887548.1 lactosylceramide 4-alpha-galactosyltransferase-like [Amblyraja radiata]XP_032887549.1 lactosylceramide 4-alpha-galactosyltransferase-like [Amblyraja radiata]XP_032887550.1 lactosylceramide 4-alpha-galactosyltransferase-like [Amblyraja radiata]XP_032887552.1 lactosylceramide 4-alpha-galactosyltransferase-like [Amblyraja ra